MSKVDLDQYRSLPIFSETPLVHGFSFLPDGNMHYQFGPHPTVLKNRRNFLERFDINTLCLTVMRPVHGSEILIIEREQMGIGAAELETDLPKADALITFEKGLPMALNAADCVPVLMTDREGNFASLVHAGREGTIQEIVIKTISRLKQLGIDPSEIIAGLGPSIYGRAEMHPRACYTLQFLDLPIDSSGQNLVEANGGIQTAKIIKNGATCIRYRSDDPRGNICLDLVSWNRFQLLEAGVLEENIDISPVCTACLARQNLTFSHLVTRELGRPEEGRFMTFVQLRR